ncbi:glycosyl transferase [Alicyclobacillus contaminans]|uniref:glycosyltransferase family 2 protein n=1 Tax=Alicyclobacillus contaminans TaxID=392016 RepID=UPI000417BF9E|nr:glycosyltransferase family 2 protein [Alicyclobacillus contaminans]GMA52139.1 glycosyl transferase [Alicyclobacillus contaminans]
MRIAVLIPCYNEAMTIQKVVSDFRAQLPDATIYVYDNNSRDNTAELARQAGAVVRFERRQGKGNVVRSMFRDIDADYYVMIDGDDTYPAEFVHDLLAPVMAGEADMAIGDRHSNGSYEKENKRPFHNMGNHLVKGLINRLFKSDLRDIMTGYRVFNRRFVKTMPVTSEGFEIETEMTLHALDKKLTIVEVPIDYRDRPEGSYSKLNTISDGLRVLRTVFRIFKDYRPLSFFSFFALIFLLLGLVVGLPVIGEYLATHYITKLPSAVLAVGLVMLSMMSLTCGFILDTIAKQHKETFQVLLNRVENV